MLTRILVVSLSMLLISNPQCAQAEELTVDTAAPVVVRTLPEAGATDVDVTISTIKVTFSKSMAPRSWSWVEAPGTHFPTMTGQPSFEPDQRTCLLPVKLERNTTYAVWLNDSSHHNFMDMSKRMATPYLLVFKTKP